MVNALSNCKQFAQTELEINESVGINAISSLVVVNELSANTFLDCWLEYGFLMQYVRVFSTA